MVCNTLSGDGWKFKYDLVVMLYTTTYTEDRALAVKLLANVIGLQIKGDGNKYKHWNRRW